MAQFDVWRNAGRSAAGTPYVVEVQSRRFADYRRRLVVPLQLASERGGPEAPFSPLFAVEGRRVFLNPLLMQSVPAELLRERVASFADDDAAAKVMRAIDEVVSVA